VLDSLLTKEDLIAEQSTITGKLQLKSSHVRYLRHNKEQVMLFKLKVGVADSSEGIPCAKVAGIPSSIIARSQLIKGERSTASRSYFHLILDGRMHHT
jgi:DNA mismatch repair ATPase MutS